MQKHDGASNDNELMSLAEIARRMATPASEREAVFEIRDLSVAYGGSPAIEVSTSTSTRTW